MPRPTLLTATLLLAIAALSPAVQAEQQTHESELSVRVPSGTTVRSLEVYVDLPGSLAREEQVADDSDSLLSVGHIRELRVDLQGERLQKATKMADQPVMFYLYSPTSRVESFEVNVQSAKVGDTFMTEGATPPRFVVEAVQLRTVGDAKGKVLKRFDDVSFKLGDVTRFPLGLDLKAGTTLGMRVWTQKGEEGELAIQLKASKKGRYPAHILRRDLPGDAAAGQGCFNPDVVFTYKGAPAGGKFVTGNPLERIVQQINNYLKGQAEEGKSGAVTVPLRVRVLTGGE